MTATVEPGTVNGRLQRELEHQGFFILRTPPASRLHARRQHSHQRRRPRAIKYGVTRDYVLQLEAVLPDGSLVNLGEGHASVWSATTQNSF